MHKRILLGIAMCAAFSANAQKRLQLDVDIKGLPEGDTAFLWAPLPQVTDTAIVKNGHLSFNVDMSRGGTTYILAVNPEGKEERGVVLYLEAGKMKITGNGPYFKDAVYTGSPFVADWVDISKNIIPQMQALSTRREALDTKLANAVQLGDEEAKADIVKQINELSAPVMNASYEWVKKHPNSGAGSFLINAYLAQSLDKYGLKDLIAVSGPELKNTFTIKRMMTQNFGSENALAMLDKLAPGITLPDTQGKTVSLADYKGKYVLVDFWASWCKPCREAVPGLINTYNKFKDKGFTVLSVSLDDKKDKWLQAIAEEKMPWAQVSDLKGGGSPVAQDYGVAAIPAAFLIDPSGKVISFGVGEQLEKKLSEVLK